MLESASAWLALAIASEDRGTDATGIAYNHIGRIERGKYNVTIDTLAVIANALGVRITFTDIEDS